MFYIALFHPEEPPAVQNPLFLESYSAVFEASVLSEDTAATIYIIHRILWNVIDSRAKPVTLKCFKKGGMLSCTAFDETGTESMHFGCYDMTVFEAEKTPIWSETLEHEFLKLCDLLRKNKDLDSRYARICAEFETLIS